MLWCQVAWVVALTCLACAPGRAPASAGNRQDLNAQGRDETLTRLIRDAREELARRPNDITPRVKLMDYVETHPGVETSVAQALEDPDPDVRNVVANAAVSLPRVLHRRTVAGLMRALATADGTTGYAVGRALARTDPRTCGCIELLRDFVLADSHAVAKQEFLKSFLGRQRGPEAVALTLEAADSVTDPATAAYALEGIAGANLPTVDLCAVFSRTAARTLGFNPVLSPTLAQGGGHCPSVAQSVHERWSRQRPLLGASAVCKMPALTVAQRHDVTTFLEARVTATARVPEFPSIRTFAFGVLRECDRTAAIRVARSLVRDRDEQVREAAAELLDAQ